MSRTFANKDLGCIPVFFHVTWRARPVSEGTLPQVEVASCSSPLAGMPAVALPDDNILSSLPLIGIRLQPAVY
eukprot:3540233-Prorocentrum_lima.AAC.1